MPPLGGIKLSLFMIKPAETCREGGKILQCEGLTWVQRW